MKKTRIDKCPYCGASKTVRQISKLAQIRKRLGMSQAELGARIGTDPTLISRWESGERAPDINQTMALARAFSLSLEFVAHHVIGQWVDEDKEY